MKTFVIGIGYKARHGKDSLATEILRQCPEARQYSFGADLKAFCRVMGWMKQKEGSVLQMVGTDLIRRVDPDIWVRCVQYQIEDEEPRIAVISDMRFPNEFAWVSQQGLTVKVTRVVPGTNGLHYVTSDRPATHISETALDGVEFDRMYDVESGNMKRFPEIADEIIRIARRDSEIKQNGGF